MSQRVWGLHFQKCIYSDIRPKATGDQKDIHRASSSPVPRYGQVRFAHGLVGPAGLEAMEDRTDLTGTARSNTNVRAYDYAYYLAIQHV